PGTSAEVGLRCQSTAPVAGSTTWPDSVPSPPASESRTAPTPAGVGAGPSAVAGRSAGCGTTGAGGGTVSTVDRVASRWVNAVTPTPTPRPAATATSRTAATTGTTATRLP